ncbi:DNA-directed RNA polymerase subunit B'' [archaeon]|nr:DNA-directed RNA polymerase subunit B'' [archaeon]
MLNYSYLLIKKYFDENSLVQSDIESFNEFIEQEMQKIIEESKDVEPTIIPPDVESFKIRLDKVWVTKPEITEADGSKRAIFPVEARLRKITYSAPIYLEVSSHINDVQRESFTTQIGSLPIMLHSKYCHLYGLNRDQLIEKGEDPDEQGGYFVINGTERVLVTMEDLASNNFIIEKSTTGISKYLGKLFSERGPFKIPHTIERLKNGLFYVSFTRVRRAPLILIIKALGLLKDEEIMLQISDKKQYDEVLINLFEYVSIKTEDDAMDFLSKLIGITQTREIRLQRMQEILDKYLLPHVGTNKEDRIYKAYNLCKMLSKYVKVSRGEAPIDNKDHYMNKRLKMSGDLLADLFRMNLKVLIDDILYNFQRIVKRGKFPSIKVIIRDKLLTSRIYSSMATGNWVGGRKGVSQRIQRHNYLDTLSHLQRVSSPLSNTQENFAARELHPTHIGRLCPSETPEGVNIGLKKNLALMTSVTSKIPSQEVMNILINSGLKPIK